MYVRAVESKDNLANIGGSIPHPGGVHLSGLITRRYKLSQLLYVDAVCPETMMIVSGGLSTYLWVNSPTSTRRIVVFGLWIF